jgi:oligopeptide/dipeptide ABC transporter ATP-binding protein
MVPDLVDYPRGCPYRARCARATERCLDQVPELRSIDDDRLASCHFPTTEEPVRHAVGTR